MNAATANELNRGMLARAGKWICCLLAAIGLLVVMVVATPLDRWWAHAYAGTVEQPRGDVLILLAAANDDDGVLSYSSYWRARYALMAWRSGGYKELVVSGGAGSGIRDFLVAEGIPAGAILDDPQAKSTRENAVDTARMLRGTPGSKVLLTSDFHMYRALRTFRKAGLDATPYSVPDVMKLSRSWYGRLEGFPTLVVETAKILDYKLRGWM